MNKIASKITGYVVWIFIILLSLSVAKNINRASQINIQVKAEKAKLAKIEADNRSLGEQLLKTQSPSFIEREIRNKLGLSKPGEAIVVLPDADSLRQLAPKMQIEEDTLSPPNWEKWERLFF